MRSGVAALAAAFVVLFGSAPVASAGLPLPASMAAVGDSISQAASSGGGLGTDYPANSWSTGTNATVNSHYLRLLALNPSIAGHAYNDSVSGARMIDLAGQMARVIAQRPDYLTVLVGGNDVCRPTVAQMTSVADFRAQFMAAMDALVAGSPTTNVYVVSIPNAYQLWQLFHSSFMARFVWSAGNVCQALLANPTSTLAADVQRRALVAQRNVDFNTALEEVCALYAQCQFDGYAAYNTAFTASDVAGDYFHPSVAGQAKLAAKTWAAGFWPSGSLPPDLPPIPDFTSTCSDLSCSFNASASTDDHGIAAYDWSFGDGAAGQGSTPTHSYAAAGTYSVTLTVTDTAGQTAWKSANLSVAASAATIHLSGLSGSATARKSAWTATVTASVATSSGAPVSAVVSGTWSPGGTASCTASGSGSCSITLNMSRKATSVSFTVTAISATGYTYDASANTASSTISVARP